MKNIPSLKTLSNGCISKIKDIENAGDLVFQKFQQKSNNLLGERKLSLGTNKNILLKNEKFECNCEVDDDKVEKYRDLLNKEKQAFIEQSKIVSQVEVENKILKNYYRKAFSNIGKELSKILVSDKNLKRFPNKINQSDSVHVNPAFGDSSGRKNAHSQNSFNDDEDALEVDVEKDHLQNNLINLHNYQPLSNKNEISGFIGNNISGTTGGDDDPVLKFNNILRKSEEKKEISSQSLKKLSQLQELVLKYQKIPLKEVLKLQKQKNGNNKDLGLNQTTSQDSISQHMTSFFGQSDIKGNLDFKDSSINFGKEGETGLQKEFEVLKEIKEEIKEESMRRKQSKKALKLSFDENLPNPDKSFEGNE